MKDVKAELAVARVRAARDSGWAGGRGRGGLRSRSRRVGWMPALGHEVGRVAVYW